MSALIEVVQRFPPLPPTVTKTYLELLLLAELSAAFLHTLTLTTLFPTWLRGSLKKGAYKVGFTVEEFLRSSTVCVLVIFGL